MSETAALSCRRIVIWNASSDDELVHLDREWLSELLKSLSLGSLQDLNGVSPSEIGDRQYRLDEILRSADAGRLVDASWPRPKSHHSANGRHLLLSQNVGILELSVRPANCLTKASITTIGDLIRKDETELLRLEGMGRKSASEIQSKLEKLLRDNPDQPEVNFSVQPPSFCLSALLGLEEFGIDECIARKLEGAGITRADDLLTRSIESLRYWACLSDDEIEIIHRQLGHVDLFLESILPLWLRCHYVELSEAFQADLEQPRMSGMALDPIIPISINGRPESTCLEEELETLIRPSTNDRNKQIIRRILGWDGSPGATLEQAGQEFGITRERARQIVANSLPHLSTVKPVFLQKAIACVEACIPAAVERVEMALVEAGITRASFRVEVILKTANYLDIFVPWSIEQWNGQRVIVNPASLRHIQEFLAAARRRVCRYGITRGDYVAAELWTDVTVESLDLCCSLLDNLVWLDESRDWFWLPTGRNAVLSRLAKILRVAPRITLAEAREGVLRDHRVRTNLVELPPEVFSTLCASLPWCKVEGSELIAAGEVPVEDEDSDETLLIGILRQFGPAMRRSDLWILASKAGIERVSFDHLLVYSNIIVKSAPEVYGLIGSNLLLPDSLEDESSVDDPSEFSGHTELEMPPKAEPGSGVFDRCDPESVKFHVHALSCIVAKSAPLRVSGTWSLMEIGLTEADFAKLRIWGKSNTLRNSDLDKSRFRCELLSVTGIEAIALTFLAYCCEVGRNAGTEGELWPIIDSEVGGILRRKIFTNSYPKAHIRDATESICSKLRIRHAFGREDEQSWFRSVVLQLGSTRSG